MYKGVRERFKNFSIKKKVTVGFSMVLIFTILFMVIALVSLKSIAQNTSKLYEGPFKVSEVTWNMKVEFLRMQKNLYQAMMENEPSSIQENINLAEDEVKLLDNDIKNIRLIFTEDKNLINSFDSHMDKVKSNIEDINKLLLENNDIEADKIIIGSYSEAIESSRAVLIEIGENVQEQVKTFVNEAEKEKNKVFILAIVMLVFIIITVILVSKIIQSTLLEGVNNISKISQNLANGKLKTDYSYDSKDELGEMTRNLNKTVETLSSYVNDLSRVIKNISDENLDVETSMDYKGDFMPIKTSLDNIISSFNNIFKSIHQASDLVASSSEEIASTTQSLSDGAVEQSSSIEELFASFNELLSKVNKNTESTQIANKFFEDMKKVVNDGNLKMQELMTSMTNISELSKEIEFITDTIEDIASQTNLLALNAAIEAARAGEYGKGFAVVAEEVKSLAEQSSSEVKHTSQIIKKTIAVVANGDKLAKETLKALDTIVKNVDDTTELVKEIAESSEYQSKTIKEMSVGVDQISEVVQTNSATAQQTAAATQELASQAQVLEEEISKFILKK